MAETPKPVLLADDGELQDVRELLEETGVPWLQCQGFQGSQVPDAVSLLITNSRLALVSAAERPRCDLHMVVYDEKTSNTLRRVLERQGCDLVLPRPLSLHTLALVAAQAMYAGPERRRGPRVVLNEPMKLAVGGRPRPATLVQLSLRGCGILTDQEVAIGGEMTAVFPKDLTGSKPLEAIGPALKVEVVENDPRQRRVSMAFRLMNAPSRSVVSKIMERSGSGAELRPRSGDTEQQVAVSDPQPDERRTGMRKRFTRRILAAGSGTSHVLIGRDLSSGGMRINPDMDLALGDELKLAVHSRPGLPAVMVRAVVARDDGDDGVLLRFKEVPASIATRLEQIMEGLPALSVPGRPGIVVSEVLDRD